MTETKVPVEGQQDQDTYQKVEQFFLTNRKAILGVLGAVVVAIGGYFGYKQFILGPKEADASAKIVIAQSYFQKDSLDLALNGDGINPGFLAISSAYKNTPTANLANYYIGTIYLKQQQFDEAISYLEKFKPGTDELAGITHMQLGHAYAEKGDTNSAVALYKKAGEAAKNDFFSPYYYKMAGDLLLELEKYEEALAVYELIQTEYPLSEEGQNILKEIAFAETKLGK